MSTEPRCCCAILLPHFTIAQIRSLYRAAVTGVLICGFALALIGIALGRRVAEFAVLSVIFLALMRFFGLESFSQSLGHGPADLIAALYALMVVVMLFAPVRPAIVILAAALFGALTIVFELFTGGIPLGLAMVIGLASLDVRSVDQPREFQLATYAAAGYVGAAAVTYAIKVAAIAHVAGFGVIADIAGQLHHYSPASEQGPGFLRGCPCDLQVHRRAGRRHDVARLGCRTGRRRRRNLRVEVDPSSGCRSGSPPACSPAFIVRTSYSSVVPGVSEPSEDARVVHGPHYRLGDRRWILGVPPVNCSEVSRAFSVGGIAASGPRDLMRIDRAGGFQMACDSADASETRLFLLGHQDDEIAFAPLISRFKSQGLPVRVVYLTDGGIGRATPERRNTESTRALASLGVPCAEITSWETNCPCRMGCCSAVISGLQSARSAKRGDWLDWRDLHAGLGRREYGP